MTERRFWLFGAVAVPVFLAGMYFSPGHFGWTNHDAKNLFNEGVIRDGRGEIGAAVAYYDRAIRGNPDLLEAYNNRAIDRRKQGNPEDAIADYAEIIRRGAGVNAGGLLEQSQVEQTVNRARLARASLLLDRNALDDAAADYSALLHTTDKVAGMVNLIRIEVLKGNFEAAVSRLDAYEGPAPAGGFYSGFLALFHDNDPPRAAAIFQKALTEGFKYRDTRAMLDRAFPRGGDPGLWLSYDLPFTPAIYQMLVWQHVARQRAGDDDGSEFQDNLRQLGDAPRRRPHLLLHALSAEDITAARVEWPGPVIDLFLGLKTPEQLDALAAAAADAVTAARRKCDVDFYSGLLALNTKAPEARALLERAAANCPANALESVAAKLELGRI
jgi:tetratricopeptide (TPR) repeat protein